MHVLQDSVIYCSFQLRSDRPRPTNRRIHSLEEENKILRRQLWAADGSALQQPSLSQSKESLEPCAADDSAGLPTVSACQDEESERRNEHESPGVEIETTYHGTTSALFDADAEPSRRAATGMSNMSKRSTTSMQNNLIAATAKQRA